MPDPTTPEAGRAAAAEARQELADREAARIASLPPAAPFTTLQEYIHARRTTPLDQFIRRVDATDLSVLDGW